MHFKAIPACLKLRKNLNKNLDLNGHARTLHLHNSVCKYIKTGLRMLGKILATSLSQLRFSSMHFGLKQGSGVNMRIVSETTFFSYKSWFDLFRRMRTKIIIERDILKNSKKLKYLNSIPKRHRAFIQSMG